MNIIKGSLFIIFLVIGKVGLQEASLALMTKAK